MAQPTRVDFHNGISSKNPDYAAIGQTFPGQTQNQGVELCSGERQRSTAAPPVKTSLIQTPMGQPDAVPVMDKDFHPGAASIGEQVTMVRLRRTKHLNYPRQDRFGAPAHVERFRRQPQGRAREPRQHL